MNPLSELTFTLFLLVIAIFLAVVLFSHSDLAE